MLKILQEEEYDEPLGAGVGALSLQVISCLQLH
jgi:hypothetical protein